MYGDFTDYVISCLAKIKARHSELSDLLTSPEILGHHSYWRRLALEHSSIEDLSRIYDTLLSCQKELESLKAEALNGDNGIRALALSETERLNKQIESLSYSAAQVLAKKSREGGEKAVIEIREAEPGGAEFAYLLFKMYENYARLNGYCFEILSIINRGANAIKYVSFKVSGEGAYQTLKGESGLHKAAGGNLSGSCVLVGVLPEFNTPGQNINKGDIKIDVFHSGGAGGQNVNKVESAIRITHIPTGITVTNQDERSQLKNKERALNALFNKVNEYYKKQHEDLVKEAKKELNKALAGNITRTYDFLAGSVKDHRTSITLDINAVLEGNFCEFTGACLLGGFNSFGSTDSEK